MLVTQSQLKIIELDFVKIQFFTPDVVVYTYHAGIHLTWPMVQEVAELTNELIEYKKCYMCAVIGKGLTIQKEVRENGVKPEYLQYTKGSAIVQNSLAHRILGNFIIKVQRPSVPTKLFDTVEDSLAWFDKLRVQEQ